MPVDERRCVLGLLGVFAAHNLEEIAHLPCDLERLPDWVRRRGPWVDTSSFTVATGLLTAAVSAASLAGLRSGDLGRAVLVGGPAAALAGNALSHMGRALVQRRYHGGLVSAPAMAFVAGRVFVSATGAVSASARRRIFVVGTLAAVPAIVASLSLGRLLTRVIATSTSTDLREKR